MINNQLHIFLNNDLLLLTCHGSKYSNNICKEQSLINNNQYLFVPSLINNDQPLLFNGNNYDYISIFSNVFASFNNNEHLWFIDIDHIHCIQSSLLNTTIDIKSLLTNNRIIVSNKQHLLYNNNNYLLINGFCYVTNDYLSFINNYLSIPPLNNDLLTFTFNGYNNNNLLLINNNQYLLLFRNDNATTIDNNNLIVINALLNNKSLLINDAITYHFILFNNNYSIVNNNQYLLLFFNDNATNNKDTSILNNISFETSSLSDTSFTPSHSFSLYLCVSQVQPSYIYIGATEWIQSFHINYYPASRIMAVNQPRGVTLSEEFPFERIFF